MTVPPASQLTRRMVPASTSRRKERMMSGMMVSTPTTTATATIRVFMGCEPWKEASPRDCGDGAASARGVDVADADDVARADADAECAVVGGECGEKLDDLAVDV